MSVEKIIIVDGIAKKDELLLNKSDSFVNEKIFTVSGLIKNLFFDYEDEAMYYIVKNYNVIADIAKIYLDNLYYTFLDIDEDKLKFLSNLKERLEKENLLIYNS